MFFIFERTTDQFDQKILHQSWELEWWTLRLMLDLLFFLISRLNIACSPLIFRLINRSGLRISHSKVFSSGQIFFKEGLIRLIRGNSYSKELLRHITNTIRVGDGTPHHFFVRTTNDVITRHYFSLSLLFRLSDASVFKRIILCLYNFFSNLSNVIQYAS